MKKISVTMLKKKDATNEDVDKAVMTVFDWMPETFNKITEKSIERFWDMSNEAEKDFIETSGTIVLYLIKRAMTKKAYEYFIEKYRKEAFKEETAGS